jgi:hypothetical protein
LIEKRFKKIFAVFFSLLFLVIKTLDPADADSFDMLDPDPYLYPDSRIPAPQLWKPL